MCLFFVFQDVASNRPGGYNQMTERVGAGSANNSGGQQGLQGQVFQFTTSVTKFQKQVALLGTRRDTQEQRLKINALGKNIKEHGFMELPLGECKNSFVCPNDMGEAATVCLLEGPEVHANKFYDICGPVPQSMHEVAADLSKAMGKKV